ncbi:MAG: proprotein convertase P-domain-containing protein [Myxococcota bacterium]|nr:proprotein convertase P-domain-containing protein [Myxococcota bacterium]
MFEGRFCRLLIYAAVAFCVLTWGGIAAAQNSLALVASSATVQVGQPFDVSVNAGFAETTVGGGVTLVYDHALLSFDSVAFVAGDPDFRCPGSSAITCPADPDYLSFGEVTGLPLVAAMATLTFTPLAAGTASIDLAPTTAFAGVGGAQLSVNLQGTSVTTNPAGLPVLSPWSVALLVATLAGCGLLIARRTRLGLPAILALLLFVDVLNAPRAGAQAGVDTDLDGIHDSVDNCTETPNPGQLDSNGDGYGNACDPDLDDDDDVDSADLALMKSVFFGSDADADLDGSGAVDFEDLGVMAAHYGGAPGPRCASCPLAAVSQSYCGSSPLSLPIPDDDPLGVADSRNLAENALISDLNVSVRITHGWVGDLGVRLQHVDTGTVVDLIDQPGVPASSFGCSGDDMDATLDDEATASAEDACAGSTPALGGELFPNATLTAFDGENLAGTWTLTAVDSSGAVSGTLEEWCLIVNDPAPPVGQPSVEMIAYRPQSEAYGAPLLRRRVPEAEEEGPGAGIRINGDDDDGSSSPDRDDPSVAGENDLIEVEWVVGEVPAPAGYEYVIRRSNGNIRVWSGPNKGTAVLDTTDEKVVSPAATTGSVWVENPSGGSAFLVLEARATTDLSVVSSDRIDFFPFTSLVIGLHGEFQFPTDPVFGPNEGVSVLAVALHEEGYDSHMYVENEVAADGSGAVYDEIVSAVQNRGVTSLAFYGFSHGGGSIYDLSERLDANKASIGSFDILFTGYIDGIENDSDLDLDPEVRLPLGTAFHVNYYQSFGFIPPWGSSVSGADVDVNVTATFWGFLLVHITITNSGVVQDGIHDPLVLRTPR